MSTPQHLESAPIGVKATELTPFSGDQHPFAYNAKPAEPVLLAQNRTEGGGNPPGTPPGSPPGTPPPGRTEGGGTKTINNTTEVTNTQTQQQQQQQNQSQEANSSSTSKSNSSSDSTSGAVSGSKSNATGGAAKSDATGGQSSSALTNNNRTEGGGGGAGGGGGTGTGGSNQFSEVSNNKSTVLIPAPIFTEQGGACPSGIGFNALGGVVGAGFTKTGQQQKCLDANERMHNKTVDANVSVQTEAIKASKEASMHAADKQADIAVTQGKAAVDLRNIQNSEVVTEQTCNYAAIFGDKAYTGYNNVQGAGKELKTNPMAKGIVNSETVLTTNFAVGSSQLIAACAARLSGSPDVLSQFPAIKAEDLTPVAPPAPIPAEVRKPVVSHVAIPRPKGCAEDPAVLRAFLAGHPTADWTAADKTELSGYFKANPKLKPTDAEAKKLAEK